MTSPARVGIVGCGVISRHYAENAPAFDSFDVVACADLDAERAADLASRHGFAVASVGELLADPQIDVVLNLTPPEAHAAVLEAALAAGKHVYSEKPLASRVEQAAAGLAQADRLGLRIGCAPDIFLGGAYQAARSLLDDGAIGEPLSAAGTVLLGGPESWHPDPDSFYGNGAGPLLDMGPYYLTALTALLGGVRRVAGFASIRVGERVIGAGPRRGERFTVTAPTHTTGVLELDNGVTATLVTSFEAAAHSTCELLLHGTDGALMLPDPNYFGGSLRIKRGGDEWQDVPYETRGAREARGIGLEELVQAIAEDRRHRASGQLALHVLDTATSMLRAAAEGRTVEVTTQCDRPAPMPVQEAAA